MRKAVAALAITMTLTGCASMSITEPSFVSERTGRIPELDSVSDATVGSTIFSQFRYWSKTGYQLMSPVSTRLMFGRVQADAGDFVMPSKVDGQAAYCTEKPAYSDALTPLFKPACFIDKAGSGSFGSVKAMPGMVWIETSLDSPVRYERNELILPRADAKKYELLYQGISSNTLRLAYREYINDFARPAYFQDVSYEVTKFPADITFRSVRISVLGADNNGIHYRVLSGF